MKGLRKLQQSCETVVRQQYGEKVVHRAKQLARTAVETRWTIDDILDLYEQYEEVDDAETRKKVAKLTKEEYHTLMESIEIYH